MSPILILTGLLAVAYFGSMLVGGRAVRGYGLPSGTEFLLLGVMLGPQFFGVIGAETLSGFEGLTVLGLSWLMLVAGAHWGDRRGVRVPRRRMFLGAALTSLCAVFTGGGAALAAALTTARSGHELLLLGVGVGAVSCETTRYAVGWVVERYAAEGPLATLIEEVAEADDGVPLALVALFAAIAPPQSSMAISWPAWAALLATVGVGGAVGATCAALFDIEPRENQRWGIVLGTTLLAVGASLRLGVGAIAATFVLGYTAATLARERAALQRMVRRAERAVMLPALILAGSYVRAPTTEILPVAAAVVGGRFLAKWIAGRVLLTELGQQDSGRARMLGLGLMPAGALSVTAGFACALRAPGPIGDLVLTLAVGAAVLGELVGPFALHRVLFSAGELRTPENAEPAALEGR